MWNADVDGVVRMLWMLIWMLWMLWMVLAVLAVPDSPSADMTFLYPDDDELCQANFLQRCLMFHDVADASAMSVWDHVRYGSVPSRQLGTRLTTLTHHMTRHMTRHMPLCRRYAWTHCSCGSFGCCD